MYILGAGMAGCLAGIMNGGATILEASPKLPNNHHGVLRFRTDNISKITGIPFKKVKVYKSIWYDACDCHLSPRMANLYSKKVINKLQDRSILNLDATDRWIAPEDFHLLMEVMLKDRIKFSSSVSEITRDKIQFDVGMFSMQREQGEPIISTIPMTVMAALAGLSFPSLSPASIKPIFVCKVKMPEANVHQTIYYPDPDMFVYRASMVGDLLIIESMRSTISDEEKLSVWHSFGLNGSEYTLIDDMNDLKKEQGKLSSIDDFARKNFMLNLSTDLNVWSLGRYACWRPSVLLDDVYDDILKIRAMIGSHRYDIKLSTL